MISSNKVCTETLDFRTNLRICDGGNEHRTELETDPILIKIQICIGLGGGYGYLEPKNSTRVASEQFHLLKPPPFAQIGTWMGGPLITGENPDLQKSQIWTKIPYFLLIFGVFSAPTARKIPVFFRLRRSHPFSSPFSPLFLNLPAMIGTSGFPDEFRPWADIFVRENWGFRPGATSRKYSVWNL